jgi:glycosyltransferase involved in cell wall biosynthesis
MLKEGAAAGDGTPAPRARPSSGAAARLEAPAVLLLGPARSAASGVATHINQLFGSALSKRFRLSQFQVGREGRGESRRATVVRLALSPLIFVVRLVRLRPRIVHINTSLDLKGYWRDLVYLAVAKALGCKVVYQIHGGALPAQFFPRSRLLTALLRHVLMWADVVVLLAKCEMTAYERFAPRARLIRIANCVSIEQDRGPAPLNPTAVLTVGYVGRLTASKGILETIEAVRILRERGVEVRLTIAGAGEAMDAIRRSISAAGLATHVHLIGEVFAEAKREFWLQTDVLALPSYHEGLPYALLEAMAYGVVPVASPVGAIPDVMQDQVHGLLVPPRAPQAVAQALEQLAGDRLLLRRLSHAARERVVTHYSITRLADQFTELYRSLSIDAN